MPNEDLKKIISDLRDLAASLPWNPSIQHRLGEIVERLEKIP